MADDGRPGFSIDPALLDEAYAIGLDVAPVIERALRRELAARRSPNDRRAAAEAWSRYNEDFVNAYNERFEREGGWVEAWRNW